MDSYIGIAITTKNRKDSFWNCYHKHVDFWPKNAIMKVIDAGSSENYSNSDYMFENGATISEAKNKSIQLLYEAGCTDLFLFDDDTFPLKKDWYKPYLEAKQHHLCFTFWKPRRQLAEHGLVLHYLSNGCAMYYSKHCIDTVGGFDTGFKNKYEHVSLSQRIHNAGLTPLGIHLDVANSDQLIYCLDKDNAIQRSFTAKEMNQNLKDGYNLFRAKEKDSSYIEFRT